MTLRGKAAIEAIRQIQSKLIDHDNWPVANWTRFELSGRIVPERCNVRISPVKTAFSYPSGRALIRFSIESSHVSATFWCDDPEVSIFQISDITKQAIVPFVDRIGIGIRAFYELILDTATDTAGNVQPIPVFEPIFNEKRSGYLFSYRNDASSQVDISFLEVNSPALALACHDLSQSLRWSPRTLEYCRMALEAIRGQFDPDTGSTKQRQISGEKLMCAALKLNRKRLIEIDAYAAPARHGDRNRYLDWPLRKSVLEFCWEVVYRFSLYLQGNSNSEWNNI